MNNQIEIQKSVGPFFEEFVDVYSQKGFETRLFLENGIPFLILAKKNDEEKPLLKISPNFPDRKDSPFYLSGYNFGVQTFSGAPNLAESFLANYTKTFHRDIPWDEIIFKNNHCFRPFGFYGIPGKNEIFLKIDTPCIQKCKFCEKSIPTKNEGNPVSKDLLNAFYFSYHLNTIPVKAPVIIGGAEPLASPDIEPIFTFLSSKGHRPYLLHTAGWPIQEKQVDQLKTAGLERVSIPIYGSKAKWHDRIVRHEGAFDKAVHAIGLFHSFGIKIHLHTVALWDNQECLVDTLHLMESFYPVEIRLRPPIFIKQAPWMWYDIQPEKEKIFTQLQHFQPNSKVPFFHSLAEGFFPQSLASYHQLEPNAWTVEGEQFLNL